MEDQKTQNCGSGSVQQGQQGQQAPKQEKPSHMNQGDRTFRPDDQKKQQGGEHQKQPASGEHRENQGSTQRHEEPARKAS
ncbi:hypothetical protein [Alloacidobacterium sp.]|uniref:hypothetical protein n=1 Tax=Alloacidobacterium sp. TaxID=2951999 RepID=UPI002D726509|nr:hypothetical protein [Alloacidobacterium sp.]HYK35498.1 hypothetical protein [Alloacidobacterium sp.]